MDRWYQMILNIFKAFLAAPYGPLLENSGTHWTVRESAFVPHYHSYIVVFYHKNLDCL